MGGGRYGEPRGSSRWRSSRPWRPRSADAAAAEVAAAHRSSPQASAPWGSKETGGSMGIQEDLGFRESLGVQKTSKEHGFLRGLGEA